MSDDRADFAGYTSDDRADLAHHQLPGLPSERLYVGRPC
jgi:hypothetical protein